LPLLLLINDIIHAFALPLNCHNRNLGSDESGKIFPPAATLFPATCTEKLWQNMKKAQSLQFFDKQYFNSSKLSM
jgi:hypothetical protein